MMEGRAAIQRDLDVPEERAKGNVTEVIQDKGRAPHLRPADPWLVLLQAVDK